MYHRSCSSRAGSIFLAQGLHGGPSQCSEGWSSIQHLSYDLPTISYDASSRDGPTGRKARYYRPAATSTRSLIAILILVASYIALLDILLSMQKIGPQSSSLGRRAQNIKRQVVANSSTATPSVESSITSLTSLGTSASASATIPSVAVSPVVGAQLSVTTPSTVLIPSSASAKATSVTVPSVAISPVISEQLSLTTPTSGLTLSSGTDTAQVQSQLSITTPSTDSFAAAKSQLSLTTTTPSSKSSILDGTSSIAQQLQLSLATISSKLTSLSETSTPSEAFTIAPASQLALTTNTPNVQSSSTSEASGSQARTSSSIPASISASTLLQISFSTFSSADGSPFSTATFHVLTTSTYQHSETSTAISSASATSSAFVLAESHVEISGTFTKFDYFLSLYLPTILAVFLQVIGTIIFATLKMMEPFYQLAEPDGALAQNSILAKIPSTSLSKSSHRALAGHRVMSLAGIIYVAIGLLAPPALESMGVEPTATCVTSISQSQPCAPAWIVYLPVARCLEGVLIFLFVAIFILLLMTITRSSGVFEDPCSMKAMAILLTDPVVVRDFQNVDPDASKAEVREVLANNRYKIGHFELKGEYRYGLFKVASTLWEEPASPRGYTPVENPSGTADRATTTHSSKSRKLKDVFVALLIMTLFGLTLGYVSNLSHKSRASPY